MLKEISMAFLGGQDNCGVYMDKRTFLKATSKEVTRI